MRTTIGLVLALLLGSTCALAQGKSGEKGHGAGRGERGASHGGGPAAHVQQAPGRSDRGARLERRAAPQRAERQQPSFKAARDNGSRGREEKATRARAETTNQTPHSAIVSQERNSSRNDKARRAEEQTQRAKNSQRSTSSQGAASGERGRSAEKIEAQRPDEQNRQRTAGDRRDFEKRIADAKHVDLARDKRSRIVSALRETKDVKHRTDARFDLRVGRRLPRDWVFLPLPIAVIDIVPEYRDYLFAYVDDDYVICDPDTYEIVAIIPASGEQEFANGDSHGRCTDRIYLGEDERDLILHSIRHPARVDVRDLTVGWSVPRDIELLPFPDPVLDRVGELNACRYFVADDQIAIVNPEEEKIVLLIDRS